jgi:ABC-type nitrate/sulfonate/bicarbonate transport system ATPase subunit
MGIGDEAADAAILAEGASKLFLDGAVVAFHQLSLAVKRNEIMCVVGPSGCGKTTVALYRGPHKSQQRYPSRPWQAGRYASA